MYLNDPSRVRPAGGDQAPRRWTSAWWSSATRSGNAGRGHTVGPPQKGGMQRGVCLYLNGRHACYVQSDYCPSADPRVYTPQEQPIAFRTMTRRPQ